MKNNSDGKQQKGKGNNGFIPSSFRTFSSYLRIVSSGASSAARSAASVAQSFVDRDDDNSTDQVQWAGFDKLEDENNVTRQVLLLGYRSGFQVWDVEEADNVRDLVSRYDGPVSLMQLLPKPLPSKKSDDKFAEHRPILVTCTDGALFDANNIAQNYSENESVVSVVRFYSLRSQSYIHTLKFRTAVYSMRCSSRIVAISQAAQIHCFDATSLEREYTILTNPVVTAGTGGVGYGPLAVGPRWLAYSGSPVAVSSIGRVSPQHLASSSSLPNSNSNGSLVAHYAKESSKQLAAGIVTLGDIGYKKLSRYYSELRADSNGSPQSGNSGLKGNGVVNGHLPDAENTGMVVVRDIVGKVVIAQFRAHKSPISALCFDPSGTLLVTASVHGHNINVFKIMPGLQNGNSFTVDASASYRHLYRLQRGLTNAVLQDISFSDDSNWIMISSSRGTSHLFAISPFGGSVNFQSSDANQQNLCASGPPVTLSVVGRIRNGNNGWRSTVTGAAAAATGRLNSLSGAIASSFHDCKANSNSYVDGNSLKSKNRLLIFSPSGSMIQYSLRVLGPIDPTAVAPGVGTSYESVPESDVRLVVEAIQKWNICQKHNRRERDDNVDIYGENGNSDSSKMYPGGKKKGNSVFPEGIEEAGISKSTPEENRQLFISEAELQMHQPHIPLWAKPQINFQSMVVEGITVDGESTNSGEVEVERIPARTIEARSKDLVPVIYHLQNARAPVDNNIDRQLQHQRSENGRFSHRSSSDCGGLANELQNGAEVIGWKGPRLTAEAMAFVNNSVNPKSIITHLEHVNNEHNSTPEAAGPLFANSYSGGPRLQNHFGSEADELD